MFWKFVLKNENKLGLICVKKKNILKKLNNLFEHDFAINGSYSHVVSSVFWTGNIHI